MLSPLTDLKPSSGLVKPDCSNSDLNAEDLCFPVGGAVSSLPVRVAAKSVLDFAVVLFRESLSPL